MIRGTEVKLVGGPHDGKLMRTRFGQAGIEIDTFSDGRRTISGYARTPRTVEHPLSGPIRVYEHVYTDEIAPNADWGSAGD